MDLELNQPARNFEELCAEAVQTLGIEVVLERDLCGKNLREFLRASWDVIEPGKLLIWGPHLDAICEHLEALSNNQIQNLVITVPPGSTKSILVSQVWPAWVWIRSPELRWLTAANEMSLAARDAVASRRLIESDWYRLRWGHRFRLTSDQNQKQWFENSRRGHRLVVTPGGDTTGKKGDILLGDDLCDVNKIQSELERQSVNGWLDRVFYDRVNDFKKGRRVLIGQRSHEDDPLGHALRSGNWEHLNIPEEFDPARRTVTLIGWKDWRTEPGELMRPERFGPEQVTEARRRLGSRMYSAIHNQNPLPVEGSLFKAAWFKHYHLEQTHYVVLGNHEGAPKYHLETLTERFLTVDHAVTVKRSAKDDPDYTVIAAWAVTPCGKLLWLGCLIARMEAPSIPPEVAKHYLRYGAQVVEVEAGGTQKSVGQYLRRHQLTGRPGHFMNVVDFVPNKDKLTTAHAALSACEAGRVWFPGAGADRLCVPAGEPETFPLEEVEGQLLRFTGGKQDAHDDVVTALSIACARLTRRDDGRPGGPGAGKFKYQCFQIIKTRGIIR
jgi:phage terminase large subunit-like protein